MSGYKPLPLEPIGMFKLDPALPASMRAIFDDGMATINRSNAALYNQTFIVGRSGRMLDVSGMAVHDPQLSAVDVLALTRVLLCAMDASIHADLHYSDRGGVQVGAVTVRHRNWDPLIATLHRGTWYEGARPYMLGNLWTPTDEERARAQGLRVLLRRLFDVCEQCGCAATDPLDKADADKVALADRVLREAGLLS